MALGSYAYIGIKNLIFKNKTTGEVECNIKHLVDLNLTDQMNEDFLRGGYGFEKLLTVYSNRDTKLEGSTASETTALTKVKSNSEVVTKSKAIQQIEEIAVSGGTFTLKLTPASGYALTVASLDKFGKETKLSLGTPNTNATDYSIVGKVITCHSSVTKIIVYYMAEENVETIEIKEITPKNWEAHGILVAKEIETGKLYKCVIEMPNVSVSPNFSTSFKNSDGAPDPSNLAINIMYDNGAGYAYALNFKEEE